MNYEDDKGNSYTNVYAVFKSFLCTNGKYNRANTGEPEDIYEYRICYLYIIFKDINTFQAGKKEVGKISETIYIKDITELGGIFGTGLTYIQEDFASKYE